MASEGIEGLKWLTANVVRQFASENPIPAYVYSEKELRLQISKVLAFPVNSGFGFQPRFAMKANPNRTILQIMLENGVEIDAGSEHEAFRAIRAGYRPDQVQLTAQQMATDFVNLVEQGVHFTACSLRQLEEFGKRFPGKSLGVRFNPGLGSGGCTKTNVGGSQSAFGVWHEKMSTVKEICQKYDLKVTTVHTHIGSGSDPEVWKQTASLTLALAAQLPECHTVNLGGGFKIARMQDEISTDLQNVGAPVKELFAQFHTQHGRKLKLEIEPGSFYMVNTGSIVCSVDDIIDTGEKGFNFIKLTVGMDNISRPALYGARHPIVIVPKEENAEIKSQEVKTKEYVVAGHCCESGDLITQHPGGDVMPRRLQIPQIGDYAVIEGSGAYCASFSVKNYNSYPDLAEWLIRTDGSFKLIKKAQTLDQVLENEL